MKKIIFLLCLLPFFIFITNVKADTGPKPSVTVNIMGVNELCYGTLISKSSSTGPNSSDYKLEKEYVENYYCSYDIWQKFENYCDSDNFYFLQVLWEVDDQIKWSYYPPKTFKVLLYFPESDKFVCSDIADKYLFHSYYNLNLDDAKINIDYNLSTDIKLEENYDFKQDMLSFFIRILITLIIEILIACMFKIVNKKSIFILILANILTQILLNLGLNLIPYKTYLMLYLIYIILELLVLFIESLLYIKFIKNDKKVIIIYTSIANISSFLIGLILSLIFPFIF